MTSAGTPQAPPLHTAPLFVQNSFCIKLAGLLDPVVAFSLEAHEMQADLLFWVTTDQTIPQDSLAHWTAHLKNIYQAIKAQAAHTLDLAFMAHSSLTNCIRQLYTAFVLAIIG